MKFGKDNLSFRCRGSQENYFGLVGRLNINNNSKFQGKNIHIKNINIDHRVKEAFAIISTKVTYETDHISLLCVSLMTSALNCYLCILL